MKSAEHGQREVSVETERRLKELFEKLDINGDGRIDVSDLTEGLQKLGVPHSSNMAMKFIESSDLTRDGVVDFAEFAQYVREHERNLKLVFNRIDENADGHIDEEVSPSTSLCEPRDSQKAYYRFKASTGFLLGSDDSDWPGGEFGAGSGCR